MEQSLEPKRNSFQEKKTKKRKVAKEKKEKQKNYIRKKNPLYPPRRDFLPLIQMTFFKRQLKGVIGLLRRELKGIKKGQKPIKPLPIS